MTLTLDSGDAEALSRIARASLAAAVGGGDYLPDSPGRPVLEERCGCFVTLRTQGRLRGCIGCFTSPDPLWKTVSEYTCLSALEDPRFGGQRIRADELGAVTMEVSVLSPLEPCADPLSIVPGVHGVYIKKGMRSGCFLPQVATEMGWSTREFLTHCCRDKAGLADDAWMDADTVVMTFTALEVEC